MVDAVLEQVEKAKETEKPKAKRGRPAGSTNAKKPRKVSRARKVMSNGQGMTNREARSFFKQTIRRLKKDLKIAEAGLLILSKLS